MKRKLHFSSFEFRSSFLFSLDLASSFHPPTQVRSFSSVPILFITGRTQSSLARSLTSARPPSIWTCVRPMERKKNHVIHFLWVHPGWERARCLSLLRPQWPICLHFVHPSFFVFSLEEKRMIFPHRD